MKKCNACNEYKQIDFFHKCHIAPDGHAYTCKECSKIISKRYVNETLRGRISSLCRVAKQRTKKKEGVWDITIEYIETPWNEQRGNCAYTNIPMNIRGDWQVSFERIDPVKGYTKGNVCLICLELNVNYQWTPGKIEYFKTLPRWQGINVAYQDLKYLRKKMYSARERAKHWDTTKRFMENYKCDLNLQCLFDILVCQQGLCSYSGIEMTHEAHNDRSVSIERKDPRKGYYKENIVLICQIFNVGDHRVENEDVYNTYPSWSKEKCEIFLKS